MGFLFAFLTAKCACFRPVNSTAGNSPLAINPLMRLSFPACLVMATSALNNMVTFGVARGWLAQAEIMTKFFTNIFLLCSIAVAAFKIVLSRKDAGCPRHDFALIPVMFASRGIVLSLYILMTAIVASLGRSLATSLAAGGGGGDYGVAIGVGYGNNRYAAIRANGVVLAGCAGVVAKRGFTSSTLGTCTVFIVTCLIGNDVTSIVTALSIMRTILVVRVGVVVTCGGNRSLSFRFTTIFASAASLMTISSASCLQFCDIGPLMAFVVAAAVFTGLFPSSNSPVHSSTALAISA